MAADNKTKNGIYERVSAAVALTAAVRNVVRHQILIDHPDFTEEELLFEMARRIYKNETSVLSLLNNVSSQRSTGQR